MSDANFVDAVPRAAGLPVPAGRRAGAIARRASPRRSRTAPAISAPTPCRRPSGWPSSTPSRTPTSRRSRRSAVSACWSARSGSPRCCCATCSSGGASWRCWRGRLPARRTSSRSSLAENAAAARLGPGGRRGLRAGRDRAGRARARRPAAADGRRRAAAACGARGRAAIVRRRDAGRAADAAASARCDRSEIDEAESRSRSVIVASRLRLMPCSVAIDHALLLRRCARRVAVAPRTGRSGADRR